MKISLPITVTGTSLLLSILFTLTYHSQADLIDETCKKTQLPDLCTSTLRSDPSSASADIKGLTIIMFEATLAKAKATFNEVNNLLKNATDPALKECFTICASEYDLALDNIPTAIKNVGSDNQEAGGYADSVIDEARTCEETFAEAPNPRTSPLTAMNDAVRQLAATAKQILGTLG